jgi:hypothetical protein
MPPESLSAMIPEPTTVANRKGCRAPPPASDATAERASPGLGSFAYLVHAANLPQFAGEAATGTPAEIALAFGEAYRMLERRISASRRCRSPRLAKWRR